MSNGIYSSVLEFFELSLSYIKLYVCTYINGHTEPMRISGDKKVEEEG